MVKNYLGNFSHSDTDWGCEWMIKKNKNNSWSTHWRSYYQTWYPLLHLGSVKSYKSHFTSKTLYWTDIWTIDELYTLLTDKLSELKTISISIFPFKFEQWHTRTAQRHIWNDHTIAEEQNYLLTDWNHCPKIYSLQDNYWASSSVLVSRPSSSSRNAWMLSRTSRCNGCIKLTVLVKTGAILQ